MTDGAFVALVFVLANLVDWLVSLISPLAYLPPAFTQNSGWCLHFAHRRFGRYKVIDFVAVLLSYTISGEHTLEAFYERLQPFARTFMAL